MATLVIDTHQFISRLKNAGMEEKQAEAIAVELKEINLEHVATKEDILETKKDILEAKVSTIKWMIGLMVGQVALIVFLVDLIVNKA
jgi:hypothetical protein